LLILSNTTNSIISLSAILFNFIYYQLIYQLCGTRYFLSNIVLVSK